GIPRVPGSGNVGTAREPTGRALPPRGRPGLHLGAAPPVLVVRPRRHIPPAQLQRRCVPGSAADRTRPAPSERSGRAHERPSAHTASRPSRRSRPGLDVGASRSSLPKGLGYPDLALVSSGDQALQAITAPGFDPGSTVVLERSPGFGPPARPPSQAGSATYEPLGLQSARISVTTLSPSIVLVRTPYDQNWHASVDGETAQVLAADYVVQGIPVPAGDHTIVLSYTDPSVRYGL